MLIFLSDQKTEKFFEKLRFADEVMMKSAEGLDDVFRDNPR